jgi:thiol-disulfide isomerase/thioredoxin
MFKMSNAMIVLKPLALGTVIFILYLSGGLQQLALFVQTAVVKSGLVNASTTPNSKTPFDYNFAIKDLDGKKVEFKDFQGKVIFLNLWATWCGPCRSEMPAIQKLYENINKEQIVFVMLSLDEDAYLGKVKSFVNSRSFTFSVYMPSGNLANQLQVPSIPTTFVITKNGLVDLKEVGMRNYNTSKFKKYLEELADR